MAAISNSLGKSFPRAGADTAPEAARPTAAPHRTDAAPRTNLHRRMRMALAFGARMVLGFLWWEIILVKIIGRERVARNRLSRFVLLARRFRTLAVALGGVWIKLGQFLSSRVDILPPEVIAELQDLQDAVPAEDSAIMQRVIEEELGHPIAQIFDDFDPQPIAAASFGQAYMAALRDPHRRVIVKVQRSHLDEIVRTDLRALRIITGWLKNYAPIRKRANVDALIDEFAAGVFAELDYEQEARNAAEFDRSFAADTGVRVPRVYAELCTRRVIVLKNVEDIKITDYEGLAAAGVSRREVARKLFETYLTQVFTHGFYHADPHPGNLFVQPVDAQTARAWRIDVREGTPFRLTYVDFGMMGRVQPAMIHNLKELILATSLRDARRWTIAAQQLGFLLPGADLPRIEQAVAALFDRFWGMGMNDITNVEFTEMYQFSVQFKDLLSTLPFQIPQNVLYLGRAANILSGMMVALDPTFNPWQALLPFAAASGAGPGAAARPAQDVLGELLRTARQAAQLPSQADAFLSRALAGQLELRTQLSESSASEIRRLERSVTRLTWAVLLAAGALCATMLLR